MCIAFKVNIKENRERKERSEASRGPVAAVTLMEQQHHVLCQRVDATLSLWDGRTGDDVDDGDAETSSILLKQTVLRQLHVGLSVPQ